jgi:hypothetical protein
MIEKALLIAAALLGGYASVTGSLPAAMVALFGNPTALKTTGNANLLGIGIDISSGVGAIAEIEHELGL